MSKNGCENKPLLEKFGTVQGSVDTWFRMGSDPHKRAKPLLTLLVWLASSARASSPEPSAARSLVWGLGLETSAVLPARFFFIQAVDRSGKK